MRACVCARARAYVNSFAQCPYGGGGGAGGGGGKECYECGQVFDFRARWHMQMLACACMCVQTLDPTLNPACATQIGHIAARCPKNGGGRGGGRGGRGGGGGGGGGEPKSVEDLDKAMAEYVP